jgi:hypothetical protein
VVTSDVAGRVGDLAHFEKLGLQQLEGREHPVDVLRVLC